MKIQLPTSIGLFEINVKHCKFMQSYSYTHNNKNLNISTLEPYDYAAMKLNPLLQYIRVQITPFASCAKYPKGVTTLSMVDCQKIDNAVIGLSIYASVATTILCLLMFLDYRSRRVSRVT